MAAVAADGARDRFLDSLNESQWLPETDWPRYQRRLLERLVRHAHAKTDYYRKALSPLFRADGTIDWDNWGEIPILTRERAQADTGRLKASSVPEIIGQSHEGRTSGSTSRVFRFLTDDLARLSTYCLNLRFYDWHGIDPAAASAVIQSYFDDHPPAYPEGRHDKGWHYRSPETDFFKLHIAATVDEQVEWLERCKPKYLTTYPSNMLELGRAMGHGRARELGLRGYFSYGEAFDDDQRREIEETFQAPMLDRYGATEVGQVSAQCPLDTRQHLAMENVFTEIVDEAGRSVGPGEPGRVVVTAFYNYSMPFIRYDVGDYAVLSADPCTCGRTLPTIDRIVGRARCLFRFKDGTTRWPDTKSVEIDRYAPHKQIQVVQRAMDRLEVRIVPRSQDQVDDVEGLTRYFRERLHPSLDIEIVHVKSIPREPSGKFFDYFSNVNPA